MTGGPLQRALLCVYDFPIVAVIDNMRKSTVRNTQKSKTKREALQQRAGRRVVQPVSYAADRTPLPAAGESFSAYSFVATKE